MIQGKIYINLTQQFDNQYPCLCKYNQCNYQCKLINLTFIDIGSDDYNEDNDDEAIDQSDLLEAVVGVGDARHLGLLPGHQPQGSGRRGNTSVCKRILCQ